jgi:hypothetical protein
MTFVHWRGGPLAWPVHSHSLGPLRGCLPVGLGSIPLPSRALTVWDPSLLTTRLQWSRERI